VRRTREEAEETRKAIAEAALRLFAQSGYAATGVDAVAKAAGVTRGAVHFHFANKRALYLGSMEAPALRVAQAMSAGLSEDGTAAERLLGLADRLLSLVERDAQVRAVLEAQWLRTEAVGDMAANLDDKRDQARAQLSLLARVIAAGIRRGELRSSEPAAALAAGYYALLMGLLHGHILDPSMKLRKHGLAAVRTFIAGMGAVGARPERVR